MHPARRLLRLARTARPLLVVAVVVAVVMPTTAAQAEPSLDQIEQQIEAKSTALEKVVENYNKVNEQLKSSRAQVNAINAKLAPLRGEMDLASQQVSALAVQAFKGGDMAAVSSVLSSGSPTLAVERLVAMDQIARTRQHDIEAFNATKGSHDAEVQRLVKVVAVETRQRAELAAKRAKIKKDLASLEELKRDAQLGSSSSSSGNAGSASSSGATGDAAVAVKFAYNALGTPYVWGGESSSGYDCSGLTKAAWQAAGVSLPHNAASQYNSLPHISRGALRAGDLVFYSGLGHVGIYVGNGNVIHAPTFGDVVKVSSVDMMTPYGYARV